MTNALLDSRYDEQRHRLALGLEPVDAASGEPTALPIRMEIEGDPPAGRRHVGIERHRSGRWVVLYRPGLRIPVILRIHDPARRYVARRLSIPIATEAQIDAIEGPGGWLSPSLRTRRPVLFPGVAYPVAAGDTGVRGRAERGGAPLRWARVEARLGSGTVVGRAQGDDRGEFLLLLGSVPSAAIRSDGTFDVEVAVTGPTAPPPAPGDDPLGDLPLEIAPPPGGSDPVSRGEQLPATYQPGASVSRTITIVVGGLASERHPFVLA